MVDGLLEYNLARAMFEFKQAYSRLVKASTAIPDLDLSAGYPFYLLDFEEIEPAVSQWCTLHANKLMESVPDRVDNPACIGCKSFRCGLGADGLCKCGPCVNYPYIVFTRDACMPALTMLYGPNTLAQKSDNELLSLYIEMCNNKR